jgi:C4-dicarboxylate transporter DctQ subunit
VKPLTRYLKYIIKAIEWAGISLMIAMSVVTFIQVIYRYVFKGSFFWAEEFAIMSMIYVTFLGATLAVRKGSHTRIDFLINKFKYKRYIEALNNVICAAFLAYLGYSSLPIIKTTSIQKTIGMQISRSLYYYAILIGCILMVLYLLVLAYCKITNFNIESGEYE